MNDKKNIILFIGSMAESSVHAVKDLEKHLDKKFRIAFLISKKMPPEDRIDHLADFVFEIDIKDYNQVEDALWPIKDQVVLVCCRAVFYMPLYAQIISLFPHLVLPTRDSIEWCQNKLMMRRKFRRHFPEISPKYTVVKSGTKDDVKKISSKIGFPCIVKPASLAASRFVSICYHEQELSDTLKKIYRSINSAYSKLETSMEPQILVEEFIEGQMFSMDGYVDQFNNVYHLPLVYVKTGQDIGIDDFFNYRCLTPTKLVTPEQEEAAQLACKKGIESLGLRNVMFHMEFIKTSDAWKIIEVDARMGGHRDMMHRLAHNIPHGMNDLLIRLGEKPVIRRKIKKYVASFNFFSETTGIIQSIKGLKSVRELASLVECKVVTKVGQKTGLSKDGYKKVVDITLANESREDLLADIRRMEKAIKIIV